MTPGQRGKTNQKIVAYQVELAQAETEIEKLLDTLTGANATLPTPTRKSRIWTTATKRYPKRLQARPLKRCPPCRLNCCPAIFTIERTTSLRTNEKLLTA